MSGQKGVIMQLRKNKAVILTANGEFRQCAADPRWSVGEEVQIPERRRLPRQFYYSAAAAAVVLFVIVAALVPLYGGSPEHQIVAYVTLDINPSIELGIDGEDIVRSAEGLNPEGERIVKQLEPIGKSLDETAASIIQTADEAGIIAQHIKEERGEIVVATTFVSEEADGKEIAVTEKVKQSIQAELAELHQDNAAKISIDNVATPPAVREEARKEGISAGKMAVKLLAEQKGLDITYEELQQQPIGQVLKEAGGMSGLLDQAEAGKATEQILNELIHKHREQAAQQKDREEEEKAEAPEADKSGQEEGKNSRSDRGKAVGHMKDKPNGKPEKSEEGDFFLPIDLPFAENGDNKLGQLLDRWPEASDEREERRRPNGMDDGRGKGPPAEGRSNHGDRGEQHPDTDEPEGERRGHRDGHPGRGANNDSGHIEEQQEDKNKGKNNGKNNKKNNEKNEGKKEEKQAEKKDKNRDWHVPDRDDREDPDTETRERPGQTEEEDKRGKGGPRGNEREEHDRDWRSDGRKDSPIRDTAERISESTEGLMDIVEDLGRGREEGADDEGSDSKGKDKDRGKGNGKDPGKGNGKDPGKGKDKQGISGRGHDKD